MVKWMEESAVGGTRSFKTISREAKKHLNEIAADFNEIYIEIFYIVLNVALGTNIYDGIVVNPRDLDRIREISRKMPFVIIPCHRSHMDYLLLHYVMEDHGIQLPFIAAGANLSFWPLGPLFRRCGAFFYPSKLSGTGPLSGRIIQIHQGSSKRRLSHRIFYRGGAKSYREDGYAEVWFAVHDSPGIPGRHQ